jgi:hypothetical protein
LEIAPGAPEIPPAAAKAAESLREGVKIYFHGLRSRPPGVSAKVRGAWNLREDVGTDFKGVPFCPGGISEAAGGVWIRSGDTFPDFHGVGVVGGGVFGFWAERRGRGRAGRGRAPVPARLAGEARMPDQSRRRSTRPSLQPCPRT